MKKEKIIDIIWKAISKCFKVNDTIWYDSAYTLYDFIDNKINEAKLQTAKEIFEDDEVEVALCTCDVINDMSPEELLDEQPIKHKSNCRFLSVKQKHLKRNDKR